MPDPVLVTGASGFIGAHVARALVERGDRVRALLRPTSDRRALADLELETVEGDLRDPDSLARAADGCCEIYHVAADYRLWAKHPAELYESNVEGTRNLLTAARRAGAERIVYTSTVGTIGVPGDEDAPVSLADMSGHYKRSKFQAEQVALEAARAGAPVVVVNPTAPIGERDVKPTPTGQIIVDFLKGDLPAYVDTGLNWVDVRDVARGHLLAAEKGRAGERYILGGENRTLREALEILARLTGRPAPHIQVPYAIAWAFAVADTTRADLTGRPPRAPLEGVRMARKKMFTSSAKAERELGYRPGPAEAAFERAIQWFRENGYC